MGEPAAVQNSKPGKSFHAFQRHEITWSGMRTRYVNRMAEITAPTLFIHGEKYTLSGSGLSKKRFLDSPGAYRSFIFESRARRTSIG